MTQYYEPEARRLESQANQSNDPAEQSRLWAEAAAIGTVVDVCTYGWEVWPRGADRCEWCERDCGYPEDRAAAVEQPGRGKASGAKGPAGAQRLTEDRRHPLNASASEARSEAES